MILLFIIVLIVGCALYLCVVLALSLLYLVFRAVRGIAKLL